MRGGLSKRWRVGAEEIDGVEQRQEEDGSAWMGIGAVETFQAIDG